MYHLVEIYMDVSVTWLNVATLKECLELAEINTYLADGMSIFICELEV